MPEGPGGRGLEIRTRQESLQLTTGQYWPGQCKVLGL